jgi:hypothetical protein
MDWTSFGIGATIAVGVCVCVFLVVLWLSEREEENERYRRRDRETVIALDKHVTRLEEDRKIILSKVLGLEMRTESHAAQLHAILLWMGEQGGGQGGAHAGGGGE